MEAVDALLGGSLYLPVLPSPCRLSSFPSSYLIGVPWFYSAETLLHVSVCLGFSSAIL